MRSHSLAGRLGKQPCSGGFPSHAPLALGAAMRVRVMVAAAANRTLAADELAAQRFEHRMVSRAGRDRVVDVVGGAAVLDRDQMVDVEAWMAWAAEQAAYRTTVSVAREHSLANVLPLGAVVDASLHTGSLCKCA